MTTTLYDLEKDIPFLEGSLQTYGSACLDELKEKNMDGLLRSIGGLHLSSAMEGVPVNTIMSEIETYLDHKKDFVILQKKKAELDFYSSHTEDIYTKKQLYTDYKDTIARYIAKYFPDQNKDTNKAYAMFQAKLDYLTHSIDALTHLESYKDSAYSQKISDEILSLEGNLIILKNLKEHFSSLGLTAQDHPTLTKLNDFIAELSSTITEHNKTINNLFDAEERVEGTLIPYVIPAYELEGSTHALHQALGLDSPSSDVKKLALLQEKLLNAKSVDEKKHIFTQIQDLYVCVYHKLCCVYSSDKQNKNMVSVPENLVLSPENAAYDIATGLKNVLDKAYNDAQVLGGDLTKKGGWFDTKKGSRETTLHTIQTYYPEYTKVCDVLIQHNQGVPEDNEKTLQQLGWMEESPYKNATINYTPPLLSSQATEYFQNLN